MKQAKKHFLRLPWPALLSMFLISVCNPASGTNAKITWQDIYRKKVPIAQGWKYIIVHHSATNAGSAAAFHRYHTKMGYGGLAYHFVIGNGRGAGDGQIEAGFRWRKQMAGTHLAVSSWYHNIFGIGICLVGNFNKTYPTKAQQKSLFRLIKKLMVRYKIPAKNILGHKETPTGDVSWDQNGVYVTSIGKGGGTSCPGDHINMAHIRKKAASFVD